MGYGKKEFFNDKLDDIPYSEEACMRCGMIKERRVVSRSPPPTRVFNHEVRSANGLADVLAKQGEWIELFLGWFSLCNSLIGQSIILLHPGYILSLGSIVLFMGFI